MAVNSYGPHGEPVITDPPSTVADMTAGITYASLVGNRIADTAANRTAFTSHFGFAPFVGLQYFETDTSNEYLYLGSGWVGTSTDGSIVAFASSDLNAATTGYAASTPVTFRNATRFTSIPIVTLGVFTQATADQHAGVANVTTTGFTLYFWRANQTATSIGWAASPNQA